MIALKLNQRMLRPKKLLGPLKNLELTSLCINLQKVHICEPFVIQPADEEITHRIDIKVVAARIIPMTANEALRRETPSSLVMGLHIGCLSKVNFEIPIVFGIGFLSHNSGKEA
jgi:hypothetical protein